MDRLTLEQACRIVAGALAVGAVGVAAADLTARS